MFSTNYDLLATAFEANEKKGNSGASTAENNQNIMNRVIELGMDPVKDQKLFWIAEQSLKAKLPEEWIECVAENEDGSEGGRIYYYNLRNQDSTWEHPSLEHYRHLYQKVKKQRNDTMIKDSQNSLVQNTSTLPEIGNKDMNNTPTNTNIVNKSPRNELKQKKDIERLGGDVSFWRTRYEMIEAERDKMNLQIKKLEQDLQSNLLQGARLIEENHRYKTSLEESGTKLRAASTTILKHLGKRGFKNDPRQHAGDVDLPSSLEDILRVIQTHIEIDEGDRDENGYSVNWDGALARIKREFDFSFTYEGDQYSVDAVELKVKLEDVTQMIVSYGEYLSPNDREEYIEIFLEHVIRAAKDSTMVPLEMISKAGVKSTAHAGRPDVLLDSPLTINAIRKELIEEKAISKSLGLELDQKRHEIDVLHTKITGLQSRLEDNRAHEELLTAKFNSLNKSIEEIRMANEITKEKATLGEKINEVNKLKSEIKTLNTQLNIANKRAADSERRLQETNSRELKLKSELSTTEMNLQLKLDKKKVQLSEVLEQKQDLELVSQELYTELQNALLISTRLEKDNESLRDVIDEYRSGDACVPVLHEKLEIEYEKNSKLKEQIVMLRADITTLKRVYVELEETNRALQLQNMELQEEYAGLENNYQKQTKRSQLLTQDNLSLENTSRLLKGQIVKLNDTIVEIKGSICVYCRVRPLFPDELQALNLTEEDILSLIHYPDYNLIDYNSIPYEFDRVFEPTVGQDDIYEEVEAFIRSAIGGCRLSIFMYGITSSGKTHTMEGTDDDPGLLYRAIQTLLDNTAPLNEYHTDITISLMEVYNEKIRDLLSLEVENSDFSLEIKIGTNGTYVDGLSEWPIRCYEEAVSLLKKGHNTRQSLSVGQSNRWVRSHYIVLIKIHKTKMSTGQTTTGSLYFIDLAGSERMKLGDANGTQLREAQNINKSLTALGDVIHGLSSKHKHIPYRNSKLTFLLQDSLKENSKILMFVTITPSPVHTGDSVASLQFGAKCRSVELGPPKKVITHYPMNR